MTAPLRIVALTSTGQVSGAERVLVRTLAAAVEAGHDVVCLSPAGALADQVAATGARHRVVPELGLSGGPRPVAALRTIGRWLGAAWVLRRAVRGADVVLVNALLALPTLRLASLAGVRMPALWLAHDVVVARSRLQLYRWCRPALTRVVGVSEAVARPLRALGAGPEVTVVHNGVPPVDPADRADPSRVVDVPVVGLNGLLTPWKGQQVLLDASWRFGTPARVELMGGQLVTDGAYVAELRARVDGTELGRRVELVGHVDAPLRRMRDWTVAVSASVEPEACPLNVLEAMSLGVPVVATDHGGSPEVLDGAGLLVPPGDPDALAAAVTRLLDDPELRHRLSVRGLERVGRAHRLDRQTAALLDQIATVAGRVVHDPGTGMGRITP
ncbi:glycosyltransferase family 4 protein [Nocardioides sp.]|uniref:glycosyltransferase family 4 protein n=1 Tax=Nocardioides sp. TaxID=35761 RepID=UPI002726E124|nr:glycosyltransferase family 4 protein [Nocardioides sp.]MDO9454929.1 glycosyltransferase family 4 protein [Nocardioides sp.]